MQFGLQHPTFSFDYDSKNDNNAADTTSQIADSLKNLVTKAENSGFDSFWVMDHFHQIQYVGRPVSRQIEMLKEVGIQYLIVDLEPSRELEALDTFANKVINKMS